MESIKSLVIIIVIVTVLIVYITNKGLRNKIIELFEKKIVWKVKLKDLTIVLGVVCCLLFSAKLYVDSIKNITYANQDLSKELTRLDKFLEVAEKQSLKYNELVEIETNIENCKMPYIIDGFKYIEGQWNTGFVIEDEIGNQFVWVPCTNIYNKEKIPILKKEIFDERTISYFSYYEQDDYEKFIVSALENGGFYISRYEIGNNEGKRC